jgi:hypothetical protein
MGRSVLMVSVLLCLTSLLACRGPRQEPAIEFHRVPPPDVGGTGTVEVISGTVRNAPPGARVVVYVQSRGSWYVQPLGTRPFTTIGTDHNWSTLTHLGTEYAAVLAGLDYQPAKVLSALPDTGKSVVAIARVAGNPASVRAPHLLRFSTYDWTIRQTGSDRHGTPHLYNVSNTSIDKQGNLHLRVAKHDTEWTCAEVSLQHSLGYGRYEAVVDGVDQFEPATVFDMFTWDTTGTDQNRREMNTQFTRWGDPKAPNGEFSVQPYYRPANTYRYSVAKTPLLLTMLWQNGRVTFSTATVDDLGRTRSRVAEHTFTADVPSPESETVHLNLCVFEYGKVHQTSDSEVVVKSFRFLP